MTDYILFGEQRRATIKEVYLGKSGSRTRVWTIVLRDWYGRLHTLTDVQDASGLKAGDEGKIVATEGPNMEADERHWVFVKKREKVGG